MAAPNKKSVSRYIRRPFDRLCVVAEYRLQIWYHYNNTKCDMGLFPAGSDMQSRGNFQLLAYTSHG